MLNCKHYLQIKGCAIDTKCAPSYANISKDHFEKKFIYPFLRGTSLIYLRFNNDIFFIWTGTQEQLTNCFNDLNEKHNSIKFEYKILQTSITFLDKYVFIRNNKHVTKIYRKNTDCLNFIQKQSTASVVLKICSKFTGEHPCQSKISIWNNTLAYVFSRKFAAYFQNIFSQEHPWMIASIYFM